MGVGKCQWRLHGASTCQESNWEERHSRKKAQQMQGQGDRKINAVFTEPCGMGRLMHIAEYTEAPSGWNK